MDRDENAAVNILNRVGSTRIDAQGDSVRPAANPNWKSQGRLSLN